MKKAVQSDNSFAPITLAQLAASRFHQLAAAAANDGGLWMPAASGSASIVVNRIARATGVSQDDAAIALCIQGGPNWYERLAMAQPWREGDLDRERRAGWNIHHITHAACASLSHDQTNWKPCATPFLLDVLATSKAVINSTRESRLNLRLIAFNDELPLNGCSNSISKEQ